MEDLRELGIGDQTQPGTSKHRAESHATPQQKPEAEECVISESVQRLVAEWVPLELCFGVPLFSDEANETVCQKVGTNKQTDRQTDGQTDKPYPSQIVSYGLFREESLRHMTAGSRLLALDLLQFISQYQVSGDGRGMLVVISVSTLSPQDVNLYSHSASQDTLHKLMGRDIPLPTRCLMFHEGSLETFRR